MPTLDSIFGKKGPNVKAARERVHDIVEEMETLHAAIEASGAEPSSEDQARWNTLANERLPAAKRELEIAETKSEANKAAALAKSQARHKGNADDGSGFYFRDAATGEVVRALGPDEKVSSAVSYDAPADGGHEINDKHYDPQERVDAQRETLGYSLGDALRSLVTGRSDLPNGQSVQAALGGIDTAGGFLLNPMLGGQLIDLAREAVVSMRAGALTIPMTTAELNLARLDKDPVSYWRGEGVKVKSTDINLGRITLRPFTQAAIVPISIELMEDAANAAAIIESALRSAMGLKLDQAIMFGSGSEAVPRGIVNQEGVNTVDTVGLPTNYAEVTAAIGKIMNANYPAQSDSLAWIQHPRDAETYDGLVDTTGQPLNPTPWAAGLNRFTTASVPSDLGAGDNESQAIIGDFSQVVVGMRTSGINIRVLESGSVEDEDGNFHEATSELKRLIVAYLRADVAVLRPQWLTVMNGITIA